jgi:hypothetical protein
LIQLSNIECRYDDIKTVLYVSGGNDSRTGSNIDILRINPAGSNYICDFSYYKKMMSPGLLSALASYEQALINQESAYKNEV